MIFLPDFEGSFWNEKIRQFLILSINLRTFDFFLFHCISFERSCIFTARYKNPGANSILDFTTPPSFSIFRRNSSSLITGPPLPSAVARLILGK